MIVESGGNIGVHDDATKPVDPRLADAGSRARLAACGGGKSPSPEVAPSGQISGTPTAIAATADYVIRAQNSAGSTTHALSIAVNGAGAFRLEPAPGTTVGVGQSLDVFFTFKDQPSDPYARDLDPALVTLSSSEPAVASVDSSGAAQGLSAGTAVLTASYQSYTGQLTIRIAGNYLSRSVAVPGQGLRRYRVYQPDDTASTGSLPVLIAFHGGGGNARHQASVSRATTS